MKEKLRTEMFGMGLALTMIWSAPAYASLNEETNEAVRATGAVAASEVTFENGEASLKLDEMKALKSAINGLRKQGDIEKVHVVAWADREYPGENEKASKEDIRLAEDRGERIKKYLQDLDVDSVQIVNMAQRPNSFQEVLNTPAAKVKGTMERTGAAPTAPEDTGILGLRGKASSALVLVYRD